MAPCITCRCDIYENDKYYETRNGELCKECFETCLNRFFKVAEPCCMCHKMPGEFEGYYDLPECTVCDSCIEEYMEQFEKMAEAS